MSELDLVVDLSKQKAKRFVDRMAVIKDDEYVKSHVFNAYYQGHLDAHCDELTLQKKYSFLVVERDKLLEENARLRDKIGGVKAAPEVKPTLFL
jgi:hypothetical protein